MFFFVRSISIIRRFHYLSYLKREVHVSSLVGLDGKGYRWFHYRVREEHMVN